MRHASGCSAIHQQIHPPTPLSARVAFEPPQLQLQQQQQQHRFFSDFDLYSSFISFFFFPVVVGC
jgi:hypothetical protein